MKRFYLKFRILLLTFALGLAGASFFDYLSDKRNAIPIELPKFQSQSLIIVTPVEHLQTCITPTSEGFIKPSHQ